MLDSEPEAAYRVFLRWIQSGCQLTTAARRSLCVWGACGEDDIDSWLERYDWFQRFNDSEIGAESQRDHASVELAMNAVAGGKLSDAAKALVAHQLANLIHLAKVQGAASIPLRDLTTAMTQLVAIERLEDGLATSHVAIAGMDDKRIAGMSPEKLRLLRDIITETSEPQHDEDDDDD